MEDFAGFSLSPGLPAVSPAARERFRSLLAANTKVDEVLMTEDFLELAGIEEEMVRN